MRILIVEDEAALAKGLKFNFEHEGYQVSLVGDGPSALAAFQADPAGIDLIMLDLMLPGMSGYETCREIRKLDSEVPVLVLSARTLSEDKEKAFDCGTDQYITKPFALPELLSRVRNLIERRSRTQTESLSDESNEVACFGEVTVDFRKFEVRKGEQNHTLTTMEQQLLRYFIQHDDQVLSRAQIMADVWGESADITTRSIDNFVMRLRRFIETDPSAPQHIVSVRGTGYRFKANP